jgi:SAM-dependent methyltransferase
VRRREDFVGKGSGQSAKLLPFPLAADLIKRNGFSRILDLGCGDGEFLIGIGKAEESVRGYGVDISPEVVALAKRRISEEGLSGRIEVMVGDIFNLRAIGERMGLPDAATSFYVLHEFLWNGRQKVVDLLISFRELFPGISLIACEITQLQPEDLRRKPTIILEHHLFHGLSEQGLVSREGWRDIFSESGFRVLEELRVAASQLSIFHLVPEDAAGSPARA